MNQWNYILNLKDVWKNSDLPWQDQRDAIVRRIERSSWYDPDDLIDIVDGLRYAETTEEFDGWWDEFYDWADANRIWVAIY